MNTPLDIAKHFREVAQVALDGCSASNTNWFSNVSYELFTNYVMVDDEFTLSVGKTQNEVDCLYLLLLAEAIEQGDL